MPRGGKKGTTLSYPFSLSFALLSPSLCSPFSRDYSHIVLVAAAGDDGGSGVERKLKTFLQTDLMFMFAFVRSSISPAEGRERQPQRGDPFLLLVFRGYGLFSLHGRMEITLVDSHKREREGGADSKGGGMEKNKITRESPRDPSPPFLGPAPICLQTPSISLLRGSCGVCLSGLPCK